MNLDLALEAERRGILPPDKQAILNEARKRGLVPGTKPSPPLYLGPGGRALTPDEETALANKPATPEQGPGFLENPVGYVASGIGKLGEAAGMSPTGGDILARDAYHLSQSLGPLGAEMSPAVAMGGDVAAALKAVPESAAPVAGAAPSIAQNAADIGANVPAVVASSPAVQGVGRFIQDLPFVGTPLKSAVESSKGELAGAYKGAQQAYGTPSVASAGAGAKTAVTNYIRGISQDSISAKYAKVDELVSPDVTSSLTQTKRVVSNIAARRGNAARGPSSAAELVQEGLSREGMNYEGIKDLRGQLRTMLDSGPLPPGIDGAEVKSLYDALTSDLRAVIGKAGGAKALDAWEVANRYTALVKSRNANLAKILGKDGSASEEAIVNKLLGYASSKGTANGRLLMQARDAIGRDGWGDVASAILEQAGTVNGVLDENKFLRFWDSGISPVGKNLLFNSFDRQGVAQSLDKIASTLKAIKAYNSGANTSKTAHANAVFSAGRKIAGAVVTGGVAYYEPFTALAGALGGRVLAHILARPATVKATSSWLNSYKLAQQYGTKGSTDMLNRSSAALALAISREFGVSDVVPRLTQEIQGIASGQAQQNQPQAPGIGQQVPNSPPGQ